MCSPQLNDMASSSAQLNPPVPVSVHGYADSCLAGPASAVLARALASVTACRDRMA
jgi:hypothetical protein